MQELDELLPVHPTLVHPLTGERLRAVGIVAGRPVWPVLGAAEDDGGDGGAGDGDDEGDQDDAGNDDGDGGSGDGDGEKPKPEDDPSNIEYWKKRSRLNEREAKKAKKERDAALRTKPKDDDGDGGKKKDAPDPEKLRQEAEEKVRAEILQDRVADKIEAKARAFADPEDAVAILLRQNDIDDFIDDGKVDVDAISEALADLAKKKPHLLAAQGSSKRFEGGGDGGARKDSGKSIDDQIEEAQKRRDFRTAIALKQKKAAEAKTKS